MTVPAEIADVALDFAREVLGWEKAVRGNPKVPTLEGLIFDKPRTLWTMFFVRDFNYTNMDCVHREVSTWCTAHGLFLNCTWDRWHTASIKQMRPQYRELSWSAHDTSLCHALMTACVEAARNLGER